MDKAKDIETLHKETKRWNDTFDILNADNKRLSDQIKTYVDYVDNAINELTKYGQRNNNVFREAMGMQTDRRVKQQLNWL